MILLNDDQLETIFQGVVAHTRYLVPTPYKWVNSDENIIGGMPTGMCADQSIAMWHRARALDCDRAKVRLAEVGTELAKTGVADHMIFCCQNDAGRWKALDIRQPRVCDVADLPYTWYSWGQDFCSPWHKPVFN